MRILRYDETDSTNERALCAIAEGSACDGDVHVARVQTAGRGRRGRPWNSPPDEGLYLTYVHLPPPPGPRAESVTVAAGLALLDAVRSLGLQGASLKWPNDLVLADAKLAGILVESRGLSRSAPHFAIGIGLNVAQTSFPPELLAEREVTSLALQGLESTPEEGLDALLEPLPRRLATAAADPAALFAEFAVAAGVADREVRVRAAGRQLRGRLTRLDAETGIEVALPAGGRERVALAHVDAVEAIPDVR